MFVYLKVIFHLWEFRKAISEFNQQKKLLILSLNGWSWFDY